MESGIGTRMLHGDSGAGNGHYCLCLWQVHSLCPRHPFPVLDSSDSRLKPLWLTLRKVTPLKKRGLAAFTQLIPKITLIVIASKTALCAAGRLRRGARRTFWERVPLGSAMSLPYSLCSSSFLTLSLPLPLPYFSPISLFPLSIVCLLPISLI